MLLTSERIKESLSFDPSTGIFVWKVKTGRSKPGMIAGSLNSFGYRQISLGGKRYFAHRLAWIWCNGEIYSGLEIDHVNGIRDDNRISNLRLVSRSQNNMNTTTSKRNQSGCRGVCFHSRDKLWHARVFVNRKPAAFKTFKSKEDAIKFVTSEREKIFGSYNKNCGECAG
ncbi:TPA: HNH endonuclease [Enterobacter cloacae]|nr:HNH endonuclease [Enterobacter cloacae]HAS1121278.1 HNH endonuclease [Enterobacter cloacae]HAS1133155.1 HNH endonuclease [Enterobacter cloacae]HDS4423428.1 HNH endonuclease [Enterobacter cloacae]HDT2155137.1 HNH endonuclease [Enterobacter cloacae]